MSERKTKTSSWYGVTKLSRQKGRIVANNKCPREDTESNGIAEPGVSTMEANLPETRKIMTKLRSSKHFRPMSVLNLSQGS